MTFGGGLANLNFITALVTTTTGAGFFCATWRQPLLLSKYDQETEMIFSNRIHWTKHVFPMRGMHELDDTGHKGANDFKAVLYIIHVNVLFVKTLTY